MSRFFAGIQGSKGPATRQGSPNSGIEGHIRGWETGVRVEIEADGDHDVVRVYRTSGSKGHGGRSGLIAEWVDQGREKITRTENPKKRNLSA